LSFSTRNIGKTDPRRDGRDDATEKGGEGGPHKKRRLKEKGELIFPKEEKGSKIEMEKKRHGWGEGLMPTNLYIYKERGGLRGKGRKKKVINGIGVTGLRQRRTKSLVDTLRNWGNRY